VAEVVWTARAERGLRSIEEYIARDSRQYAARMVRRIRAAAARLADFPASGRQVPELPGTPYREVIVEPYRVVYRYRPEDEVVLVMAVVHGRQLLRDLPNAE